MPTDLTNWLSSFGQAQDERAGEEPLIGSPLPREGRLRLRGQDIIEERTRLEQQKVPLVVRFMSAGDAPPAGEQRVFTICFEGDTDACPYALALEMVDQPDDQGNVQAYAHFLLAGGPIGRLWESDFDLSVHGKYLGQARRSSSTNTVTESTGETKAEQPVLRLAS